MDTLTSHLKGKYELENLHAKVNSLIAENNKLKRKNRTLENQLKIVRHSNSKEQALKLIQQIKSEGYKASLYGHHVIRISKQVNLPIPVIKGLWSNDT